jgi:BCD family chlorophyll transporter-like MFS transporter
MSTLRILRLGLFQLAAGGLSVLFLGVLNRVMRVELGLSLFSVTLLLGGGHYLGALVAIPFGYYSDGNRIFGYRRSLYVVLGALVACGVLLGAPWVARWLAVDPTPLNYGFAFLYFLTEGIATFVAGTAYLALIAERNSSASRAQATSLVWTMLMVGIITTGSGAGAYLGEYKFEKLVELFFIAVVMALVLTLVALWRQEPRETGRVVRARRGLRAAAVQVLRSGHSRRFALFLMVGMFSYFMQDVILEPFGGEVFGLSAASTTRFNAYMGIGLIAGMLPGGLLLIPRIGKSAVAQIGCTILVLAFGLLAASGFAASAAVLPLLITLLGLGAGFFTVGSVALMMDMTLKEHTGLFVGVWTLAQAVAKGPASLVAGALQSAFVALGAPVGQAYGTVFAIEALGMLWALLLLRRVEPKVLPQEFAPRSQPAAHGLDQASQNRA